MSSQTWALSIRVTSWITPTKYFSVWELIDILDPKEVGQDWDRKSDPTQYKDVNRKVRSERKHQSLEYAPTKTRLDSFFNELIGGDPEYAG